MLKSASIISILSFYPIYKINKPKRLNVVLDMDETLLHTQRKDKYYDNNNSNVNGSPIETEHHVIFPRPFLNLFLKTTSKFANLYLMTKGTKHYAKSVLDKLEIKDYFVDKKYREDLTSNCKDLGLIIERNQLTKSILIDDKKSNQCENQELYHIPKFTEYVKYDYELIKLFFYLLYKS